MARWRQWGQLGSVSRPSCVHRLSQRIGFGFRNFENYRIRAPLYAGKPNWRVLGSIVVHCGP